MHTHLSLHAVLLTTLVLRGKTHVNSSVGVVAQAHNFVTLSSFVLDIIGANLAPPILFSFFFFSFFFLILTDVMQQQHNSKQHSQYLVLMMINISTNKKTIHTTFFHLAQIIIIRIITK